MTSTFVLVNAAMAVADLGIGIGVYRIYRWASSTEPGQPRRTATRPATRPAPVRQAVPVRRDLADLA